MLSGSAENEVIVGAEPFPEGGIDEIAELQPAIRHRQIEIEDVRR